MIANDGSPLLRALGLPEDLKVAQADLQFRPGMLPLLVLQVYMTPQDQKGALTTTLKYRLISDQDPDWKAEPEEPFDWREYADTVGDLLADQVASDARWHYSKVVSDLRRDHYRLFSDHRAWLREARYRWGQAMETTRTELPMSWVDYFSWLDIGDIPSTPAYQPKLEIA